MARKRTIAPAAGVPLQPAPANDQGRIFTVPEVAARWRVHRHTVTAAINKGRLQAFMVGERHLRVREAEVVRYENEHRIARAS